MPKQSWKSSSLPIRISETLAISQKMLCNSSSLPCQKEARWFRSKEMRVPYFLAALASSRQNWLVSGDNAPIKPDKCRICTPSCPKIRSKSKSLIERVLPTSPARSFCTRGPRVPYPESAILNWCRYPQGPPCSTSLPSYSMYLERRLLFINWAIGLSFTKVVRTFTGMPR